LNSKRGGAATNRSNTSKNNNNQQIFELKVLRDYDNMKTNEEEEELLLRNNTKRNEMYSYDDEFGGLEALRLDEGFSVIR
jgi:hypothetical protein